MRRVLFALVLCLICWAPCVSAHLLDTLDIPPRNFEYKLGARDLVVPSALILYGAIGTYANPFKRWNANISSAIGGDSGSEAWIFDQLRFVPVVSVYLLDLVGVKAQHRFLDRSIVILTSYALTSAVVYAAKETTGVMRPDSSSRTSFPSGHAALAFAGAEFIRQEFKGKSVWYGVAGYAVATTVAGMRVVDNRHWLTDVVAAAGVGMLCTQTAYFLHERVRYRFAVRHTETVLLPYYNHNCWGVSLAMRF
ncbi:MAG: phosphatase PAP2 family protein [Bacteroidales bacterium]|nr:phosphatase PAP2 family protein [Bacteroidales bacterium]